VSDRLTRAEAYYAVAADLMVNAERCAEMANTLNALADRMCEQNIRETTPKSEPATAAREGEK
jgi:hypothetical protein